MEITVRKGMDVKHPLYGKGSVVNVEGTILTIHFPNRGNMDISKRTEGLEFSEPIVEVEQEEEELSMSKLERTLRNILEDSNGVSEVVPMGDKWIGGTLLLQPGDSSLKPKEIPIETFFHKIVMVRDRIRVMEQQINANSKLNDAEKVDLQQYITRIYGSLTTFNVLFKDSSDYFVGEKKSS